MKRCVCFWLLGISMLSSCYYEVAKPAIKQHVHIASDVLTVSDSLLFQSLWKFKRIDVHIHHMSIDSLSQTLKKEGLSTRIDLILFSSIEDGLKLEKLGYLQTIYQEEQLPKNLLQHVSASKKLLGFGYNPYIVMQERSDSIPIVNYADLQKNRNWNTKSQGHLLPFFAGVKSGFSHQKQQLFSDWIKRFLAQETSSSDSLSNSSVSFGRYTDYVDNQKKSQIIRFPNQQQKGVYADMMVTGIVRQARNYNVALEVLETMDYSPFLNGLTKRFNVFPSNSNTINYKGTTISVYPISPMNLIKNYDNCRSELNKRKKKRANL